MVVSNGSDGFSLLTDVCAMVRGAVFSDADAFDEEVRGVVSFKSIGGC